MYSKSTLSNSEAASACGPAWEVLNVRRELLHSISRSGNHMADMVASHSNIMPSDISGHRLTFDAAVR